MIELAAALAVLALTHWVPSAPGIRPALVRRLGLPGFRAVYSVVSLAAVAWLIMAYAKAADGPWLWAPPWWGRWVAVFTMPFALWLIALRLLQRPADTPRGVYRLTAVPGSLGLLTWAGLHLLNVGAARSVLLFAAFALIALVAMVKNLRTAPPARRQIGWLPGLAAILGRERIVPQELGLRPLLLALAAWAGLLALHPLVIGPDPLAGALP